MSRTTFCQTVLVSLVAFLLLPAMASLAQDDESSLEQCDHPIGTLAVVEPQSTTLTALHRYNLKSPTSLIRMMVQQSNCFLVVERGRALQNMQQERELARSGELQQDENVGGGQMKAAGFLLTPDVIFSEDNAGGIGGAVGGLIGRRSRTLGALAGGLKFKEALTSMLVSDARSGIQVAAADGKAKKADFSLGMLGVGGGMAAGGGGYTNTNEGKVIAASFLDNFNKVVSMIRADPSLQQRTADVQPGENAKAGAVFAEGAILIPKIDNVQVLSAPAAGAEVVAAVKKLDEFVFLGEEENGYLRVQGSTVGGWVQTMLMASK